MLNLKYDQLETKPNAPFFLMSHNISDMKISLKFEVNITQNYIKLYLVKSCVVHLTQNVIHDRKMAKICNMLKVLHDYVDVLRSF